MAGKRGQNEGSIYQLNDGRWRAVVNLGYEWKDGKRTRKRKNIEGKTRGEVATKLIKVQRDMQQGLPVDMERVSVARFLSRWLEDSVKPSVAPRTYVSYDQSVTDHIVPVVGSIMLDKLTPQDVQRMVHAVASKPNISPQTAEYQRRVLRIALGKAMKWGLIFRNVAALVDPLKVERHEVRPLTVEEARRFLDAVKGERLGALYTVAVALGMRKGEIFGLRWQDVDLDAGRLTVRYQLQRMNRQAALVAPKTARSRRTIDLPSLAVDALRRHKVRQLEERLQAGARWQADAGLGAVAASGLVFCTPIGTPLDSANVTHAFHKALRDAELPRQRFHDLRHCAASLMLAQGFEARVVMEILGHSQISTTMDLYAHVLPSVKRDVATRMDAMLSGSA